MSQRDEAAVKRMAELLRRGAAMLAQPCPQCGAPLLQVEDDIYCATCDRKIVVVDTDEDVTSEAVKSVIPGLKDTLLSKIEALRKLIEVEDSVEDMTILTNLLVLLLQALEKTMKISTS